MDDMQRMMLVNALRQQQMPNNAPMNPMQGIAQALAGNAAMGAMQPRPQMQPQGY